MDFDKFVQFVWNYGILATIGLVVVFALGFAGWRAYKYLSVWIPGFLDKHLTLIDTLDNGLKALSANDTASTAALSKLTDSMIVSQGNHDETRKVVLDCAKTTHGIVRQGVSEILDKVNALREVAALNPQMANIKPDLAKIEQGAAAVEKKAG